MKGHLSSLVVGAAAKRLKAVEADPTTSNQHEFNGVQQLRAVFGEERRRFPARFLYLGDDESETVRADGFVTWYDAREAHPVRSEYRLYFPATEVSGKLRPRDLAVFLRRSDGSVLVAFAPAQSTHEHQLLWLFNLPEPEGSVLVRDLQQNDVPLSFPARIVLSELGLEPEISAPDEESELDILIERYGDGFPPTAEFSAFARASVREADARADPDGALIMWLEREEALFRHLERHLVLERLRQGFGEDVDTFISFSLSVQNRRKSRVGFALEHHVEALLVEHGIAFERGAITERRSRPDFLFPSAEAYRNPEFPAERLGMLATKSTCKDRWRQILAEADRISRKHLLTLEPAISSTQMQEMEARSVVVVVPRPLIGTFAERDRHRLVTVADFLRERHEVQAL